MPVRNMVQIARERERREWGEEMERGWRGVERRERKRAKGKRKKGKERETGSFRKDISSLFTTTKGNDSMSNSGSLEAMKC